MANLPGRQLVTEGAGAGTEGFKQCLEFAWNISVAKLHAHPGSIAPLDNTESMLAASCPLIASGVHGKGQVRSVIPRDMWRMPQHFSAHSKPNQPAHTIFTIGGFRCCFHPQILTYFIPWLYFTFTCDTTG